MDKRGIELTINFIVVLIIGIAMLSGALLLTSRLFGQAEEYKRVVDAQTQKQIRQLITDSDDLVVIYPSRKIIPRTKSYTFGVGVQNVLETPGPQDQFALSITLSKALDKDKDEICDWYDGPEDCEPIIQNCDQYTGSTRRACFEETWVNVGGTLTVKKNEVGTFAVPITVTNRGKNKGLPSGLYIFNVCVCHDAETPGSPSCIDEENPTVPPQCEPGWKIKNLYGNINKVYVQVT